MMKAKLLGMSLLSICLAFSVAGCSAEASAYKEAKKLMEEGQYSEAAELFTTITEYEDSQELYLTCVYNEGMELMDAGAYSEAADLFATIPEYEDAKELYSSCVYTQGQEFIENNNYTEAKECFEKIPEYKDSSELVANCEHILAVKNDKTAPVITGVSEGEVLEAKFNEEYNLKTYLDSVIKITDDVTEDLKDYSITTTASVYDPDTGEINTLQDGTYEFAIIAVDEAENKATINFSVHVDAVLHLTKDTEYPVVLYENDLGKYMLNSAIHYSDWESAPDYLEGYYFEIEIENHAEVDVSATFGRAYLNDYRVPVYCYTSDIIAPGKKGIAYCAIYDEDLNEKTKNFEKIECEFIIKDRDNDKEEEIFVRPVIIDNDLIVKK